MQLEDKKIEVNIPVSDGELNESITIGFLKQMVDSMLQKEIYTEKTPLSFEFIVASCFPEAYQSMLNLLDKQYQRGYDDAKGECYDI